jgi:hypothetical protein
MRPIRNALLTALVVVCLTFGSVFAGNMHITGSTSWSLASLKVSGTVVGLKSAGVTSGYIRFVGYGYCYDASGHYLTPTDPNQMDGDSNTADDYPEVREDFTSPSNKYLFSLELINPGDPGTNTALPCAPGTWVWGGATLQAWQYYGDPPGHLWDQKNFVCSPTKSGDGFECR